MKRFILSAAVLVIMAFTANNLEAQLPKGSVGIGSSFSNGGSGMNLNYAFGSNFDLGVSLGYLSMSSVVKYDSDTKKDDEIDMSLMTFGLNGRYFLKDNENVDPYLYVGFAYASNPNELSLDEGEEDENLDSSVMGLNIGIGAQAEIYKSVFIYSTVGLSYSAISIDMKDISETTNTTIGLFTTSVGITFYFN